MKTYKLKLYFVKGHKGYDEEDPILVLAYSKKQAERLALENNQIYEDNSGEELFKAGQGLKLKKGIIWKQFNAG